MTIERTESHELLAERDRLIERFVLMQSELGGLFYEMAIRDHLQLDLLVERAAAMQRVQGEIGRVEQLLDKENLLFRVVRRGRVLTRGAARSSSRELH